MKRRVLRTNEEIVAWCTNFTSTLFAFDTETTSLRNFDLQPLGISICDGYQVVYIVLRELKSYDCIKKLFDNAKIIIAHNMQYDLQALEKLGITPEHCELHCTLAGDHLIDNRRKHGLKDLAVELLNEQVIPYKEAISQGPDSEKFYKYATDDAIFTWKLYCFQLEKFEAMPRTYRLFKKIEMPFQWVLVDMHRNGVQVDRGKLEEYIKWCEDELFDLQVNMHDILHIPYTIQTSLVGKMMIVSNVNFNSGEDVAKILYDDLKLVCTEYTDKGSRATNKKALEAFYKEIGDEIEFAHPFVESFYKYKLLNKIYNSFLTSIPSFIDSDGRIRPFFNNTGTATGRLSSSEINYQQLPKKKGLFDIDIRSLFVVQRGYSMVVSDYSGQELRVLAQQTLSPQLIDVFKQGKDLHLSTANDFFSLNIPNEALFESHKDFNVYKKKFAKERFLAKAINFGVAYGKSAMGFAKDMGTTTEEAQGVLDKYFGAYPEVKKAIETCHRNVDRYGYVESMAGRRRYFEKDKYGRYPKKVYRQSFNFLIQSFSADMIRKAMTLVREESKLHPEWGLKTLFTVHDEAGYEVRTAYAKDAAKRITEIFESCVKFKLPVVADTNIAKNYGECK